MPIKFKKTKIEGLVEITPHFFEDARGYFIKEFEKEAFESNNLPVIFYESNESKSQLGTIRGLHFQTKFTQGKLIRVISGSVFDVAVDLRVDSSTFGKWESFLLTSENHKMIYIPPGFGHGFLTLEKDTIFSYKCTNKYSPEFDSGIKYDDKDLNINWPIYQIGGIKNITISKKDSNLMSLSEFKKL